MAGYDLTLTIKPEWHEEAKKFLGFLKNVGKKYPVKISYKTLKNGEFYLTVDGTPGAKIDALFQELILNRGLYYYICSLSSGNKREIAANAVLPIFQGLIESRFENPYGRFLRKHILGKISQDRYVPGDFFDAFSHEYEVLFRKWDIGLIDDWGFILDLDSFLNKFMLVKLAHEPGTKSPKFRVLVDRVHKSGVGMVDEIKSEFLKIHKARTLGLHRLKSPLTKERLAEHAIRIYSYFEYFDEFQQSQAEKTEKLHGKRYKRIKYGDEIWLDEKGNPYTYEDEKGKVIDWKALSASRPCGDCAAIKDQYHCSGCDIEQCPRCGGQRLSCDCKLETDWD